MPYKELISIIAVGITLLAFYPYICAIKSNRIKPHVFSWVIWGITTFIVFLAQYQAKGGAGAVPIGVSGVITLFVAWLAFRRSADTSIHRADWFFLSLALLSLPFWYFTSDPLWAVVVLTITDLLGFGPTIRKAYQHPFDENTTFFALFATRNLLVIIAMENYSLTTILFPAAIGLACMVLIAMILYRRRVLIRT